MYDQAIIPESHLNSWPIVFEPFKIIFVYRNPKDQVADLLKTSGILENIPWSVKVIFGLDKESRRALKVFLDTTLMRMKKINEIINKLGGDVVLAIDFEGMVTNYEEYKLKIEEFLGPNIGMHINKKKLFDPQKSIKNIGIWPDYLQDLNLLNLEEHEKWYNEMLKSNSVLKN